MKFMQKWGILFVVFSFLFSCTSTENGADSIFYNGIIYTVDENFSVAEAIVIEDETIVFVGPTSEAMKYADDRTNKVDLKGKTVVPGLTDSHCHFLGIGKRAFYLNLDGSTSLDDFLNRIKAEVKQKEKDEWIIGRGWIEEDWPQKKFPTRYDLDKISTTNPMILTRADGHAVVANSRALEIAGIDKKTPNPEGGHIERDKKSGLATGIFVDNAIDLISIFAPADTTPDMVRKFALKAQEVSFKYGLTQLHDMGIKWPRIDILKEMYAKDELKIRLHSYVSAPGLDATKLLEEGSQVSLYDSRLTIRGIKCYQDGALGSRGAALLAPYSDANSNGLLLTPQNELYTVIRQATEKGIQVATHAIGDRGNRLILDLYEKVLHEVPVEDRRVADPRHRVEHAQIVAPEDIPRFAKLGIIPSMQPSHAIGDLHFAVRRLGKDRMTRGYAWRSFIDNGCIIPGGSDAPVEEGNPMIEFYAASVRKDTTGFSNADWHPELRLSREESLKMLTSWAAYAGFEENIKGTLEKGKLADFTVLNKDLMNCADDELFNIQVELTVLGGEIVFQN
ncbi:MAG: amidohydrolase [Calditrichaeota bacterium]|nr:MAG: amidohydrolase [Calditrichota bacterium]